MKTKLTGLALGFFLLTAGLVLLSVAPVRAEQKRVVDDVQITGNRNVDAAAIKMALHHTSGQVSDQMISDEVKTLYGLDYFDQVAANLVETRAGHYLLRYDLVEKPLLRKVFIKGNEELDEEELSKVLNPGARRFIDKGKIAALVRSGEALYQKDGYYDAKIESSVVPAGEGQVDVTFSVKEGERVKIREIEVRGIEKIDADDLLAAAQTKRYKWWNSWLFGTGRLNREMLDNDKSLMRQYLLDHGYVDGSISDPSIERREDGIHLTFEAKEGPEYKFGSISAAGDLLDGSGEKTLEEIKAKTGETFSAASLREDSYKISDRFSDIGYAFVNVVPDTAIRRDAAEVDVKYTVQKGKPVTVNRIGIKGNTKTYDNVIRRELKVEEQELYSSSKVKRSQELLQRLGYFEEVNISTVPGAQDDKVDLDVNVREASTGQFTAGAGYSSSDGPIFNARVSENNLFGTGRSASVNVDVGTERSNLILSATDRRFNDSYWSLGADLFMANRQFDDFDRRLAGGAVTVGYPLEEVFGGWAEDISFSTKYEYMEIDIANVDLENAAQLVIDSKGRSSSGSLTPKLVRNTINNPINPSKGSRQELSFEQSGFGGEEDYYLAEVRNTWYQPMFDLGFGDFVFSWRTWFGYGEAADDARFPLFKRYFPGGINTVRGYRNRSLGPKDDRGNEYGGAKQLIYNLDLIFPLINSAGLKGVFFYDWGQAFDDGVNIKFQDLREAYGLGLRWNSPIGPIRIEFGFPIDPQEGEKGMVTMFSFGSPIY